MPAERPTFRQRLAAAAAFALLAGGSLLAAAPASAAAPTAPAPTPAPTPAAGQRTCPYAPDGVQQLELHPLPGRVQRGHGQGRRRHLRLAGPQGRRLHLRQHRRLLGPAATATPPAISCPIRCASRTGSRPSRTMCTPRGSSSASTPAPAPRPVTYRASPVGSGTSSRMPTCGRPGAWTTSSTTTATTPAPTQAALQGDGATRSRPPGGRSSTASASGARTSPGTGLRTSAIPGVPPGTSATPGPA